MGPFSVHKACADSYVPHLSSYSQHAMQTLKKIACPPFNEDTRNLHGMTVDSIEVTALVCFLSTGHRLCHKQLAKLQERVTLRTDTFIRRDQYQFCSKDKFSLCVCVCVCVCVFHSTILDSAQTSCDVMDPVLVLDYILNVGQVSTLSAS